MPLAAAEAFRPIDDPLGGRPVAAVRRRRTAGMQAAMRLDKDTILELLRSHGQGDKVPAAQQELPDQVDTDNERDRGLLQGLGLDLGDLQGLLSKLPSSVTEKLPGGIGKLLGN